MEFKDYNPLDGKIYQVMDEKGKIVKEDEVPDLDDDELLYLYRLCYIQE